MNEEMNEWTKYGKLLLDVGSPGEYDCILVCIPSVIKEDNGYKLWYSGWDGKVFRIGLATSTDGVKFEKYEKNPVLEEDPQGWDDGGVVFPHVMKEEGEYKMWYSGLSKNGQMRLGFAISADGKRWSRDRVPIMEAGKEGEFDDDRLLKPSVIKDGNIYRMAYAAIDKKEIMRIGVATSRDGRSWQKYHDNPVIDPEPEGWDAGSIEDPHLIRIGDKYYIAYAARDKRGNYRIGLGVSEDGEHYSKRPKPILGLGNKGSFEEKFVAGPYILYESSRKIVMYYHGRDSEDKERISLAYLATNFQRNTTSGETC